MPVLLICPLCGDEGLEAGATGLDLCTHCGGLSRDGRPLQRQQGFQGFDRPDLRDVSLVEAHGVIVQAGLLSGVPAILVVYVMSDGVQLPPFVLTGAPAAAFPQLVADAWACATRSQN